MDICANFLKSNKKKEIIIPSSGRKMISTGLAIELPNNCEGQIRSRSGLAIDYGLMVLNSPGTIDQDFRGHLKIILANFGTEDYLVKQGDRIAQLVISNVVRTQNQTSRNFKKQTGVIKVLVQRGFLDNLILINQNKY